MQNKIIQACLVAVATLVAACVSPGEKAAVQAPPAKGVFTAHQRALADVEIGSMAYRLMSAVIVCTGEIEVPPEGMASVTAPLGGYIASTGMVPGRYVKKGHLLASLTNPEYIVLQQSYLETAGQLKFARQDFERQSKLQEQNATATRKMQESESDFAVLKARLAGVRAQLKLVGIDLQKLDQGQIQESVPLRAPITGYVTAVNNHPGEFVEPRETIFEMIDMTDLHLHLNVFEQDISKVNRGQRIRFRLAGADSGAYNGTVSLVSPKRNDGERSFHVHGHIDGTDEALKPGMYVQAEILQSADSLPAVPESALVYRENKGFVITEDAGYYRVQPVETGVKMDGWVQVLNADAVRDQRIVVRGASRLFAALERAEP